MLINIFGRSGVGKSTLAMEMTVFLKKKGISVEYVPEYAKDLVYKSRGDRKVFSDLAGLQIVITGRQIERILDAIANVDVVITDSPFLLGTMYKTDREPGCYDKMVLQYHNMFYPRLDFLLETDHEFDSRGRNENEMQSREIGKKLRDMAKELGFIRINSMDDTLYYLTGILDAVNKLR